MTDAPRGRRFCSCSEFPPHLDATVSSGLAEPVDTIDESGRVLDEEFEPETETAGTAVQFCTCAKVPAHIAKQDSGVSVPILPSEEHGSPAPAGSGPPGEPQRGEPQRAAWYASKPEWAEPADEHPDLESVSDLLPNESSVCSVFTHGEGGSEVVLTERRVLLRGAPDGAVLHASMRLEDIDSVVISRARPRRRSLIWGLIGIGASIGMWQALDGVGNLRLIIAAVVLMMSCLLLADYFLRPPDLEVVMRARSSAEMRVAFAPSNADGADRFAARVISKLAIAD